MSLEKFTNYLEGNPRDLLIEDGYEKLIPRDFLNDPFGYFESNGVNVKSGEKKFREDGTISEDPSAVKILPDWHDGDRRIEVIGKRVNKEKGAISESGDALYEYNVIRALREIDLPAPIPVCAVEVGDEALFITEKISGVSWHEKDNFIAKQGWGPEIVKTLLEDIERLIGALDATYRAKGVVRKWKPQDLIFDIDIEQKRIRAATPVDFERTAFVVVEA